MCLCVLLHREVADYPLVMVANREEHYGRPSRPPSWIGRDPVVFAGQDERAGGTWQGINQFGLLVAITNRVDASSDPRRRSRGLLVLEALRHSSARQAVEWAVQHLETRPYNPHNLICADARQAFVLHYVGRPQVKALSPGLHILADTDIDDPHHPRVQRVRDLLSGRSWPAWDAARTDLERLVKDHAEGQALCRHGDQSGTLSSSLIALRGPGLEGAQFFFAPGPPCTHPFEDLSPHLHISS